MRLPRGHALIVAISLVALLHPNASGNALIHAWSHGFGGTGTQHGLSVATDASGNSIIIGYFDRTTNFGGGDLTSAGGLDVFLAKYNASGDHLWSYRFGGPNDQVAFSVTTDADENIIVTGIFLGTVNFGGGNLVSEGQDIFLAKFNSAGVHQWSKRFGDATTEWAYSVATDADGSAIVTGIFYGTLNFGGGDLVGVGLEDMFLAKFNSSGVHQWSQRFGDADSQFGRSVAADAGGNVFVTGNFGGTINFGGGNLMSAGSHDVFVAKFSAAGIHQSSTRFGDQRDQRSESIIIDTSLNVIVAGYFRGSLDFGGEDLVSPNDVDAFVVKFDADGVHQWSHRFGGPQDQFVNCVRTDGDENVIVAGYFYGEVDFGGGILTSAGSSDVLLAKLSSGGVHKYSQHFGDTAAQFCHATATDGGGNAFITGYFLGTIDFGGGPFNSGGIERAFVAKLNPEPVAVTLLSISASERAGGVDLAWDIDADERFAGFRVYRATGSSDLFNFSLLDPSPLPSSARGYRDESPARGTRIAYFVTAVLPNGREIASQIVALSVSQLSLVLEQNAPNPFNPSTTIAFTLPRAADVELSIYDIEGRLVRTLLNGRSQGGRHESRWDGSDLRGEPVASGIYVYRLRAGTTAIARRMLLLK